MQTKDSLERWRIVLSDGGYFVQSMLGAANKQLITDGTLKKNSVVKLKGWNSNKVNQKRILILTDIEVLPQYGEPERIGNPETIDNLPEPAEAAPAPSVPGFYGKPAAPPAAAPSGGASGYFTPIESITPYNHKYTIRGRVVSKTPVKSWHNQNGEGRLFSVTLVDETGDIRATAFSSVGNDIFDGWYELLQEGGVYTVSAPCSVKFAKKQFNNTKHDYELGFESATKVEKAVDQGAVPQIQFNFTTIEDLEKVDPGTVIDCMGILREVGEVGTINSKTTSKDVEKREIIIVDDTRRQVRLTLWRERATGFDAPLESVVAFKGVKVSDFGGRSLSLSSGGIMRVDPDIDDAHRLKGWYDAQGKQETYATHEGLQSNGARSGGGAPDKTVRQVKEENLGMNAEKPDFFMVRATVMYISPTNISYPSCRGDNCKKKVMQLDPGWQCDSCDRQWETPEWRYVMRMSVADHTGHIMLNTFDDQAKMIVGRTADEMHDMSEADPEGGPFKDALTEATCKEWVLKCRAKLDMYNDEARYVDRCWG
jgi:replication factor A1